MRAPGRPAPPLAPLQRPRWPLVGSPLGRFAPPPPGSPALGSFPARHSLDPPPLPLPDSDGRGLPPSQPPAALRGPLSELQGLRSRVPWTGPALPAAAQGNLSLPCHQVPAEEGEGRDAAFPVPPARLDLRGLRLPGNSRAAAGPGSARGLLGAGPERFGRTSLAKRLLKKHGRCGSGYIAGMAADGTGR